MPQNVELPEQLKNKYFVLFGPLLYLGNNGNHKSSIRAKTRQRNLGLLKPNSNIKNVAQKREYFDNMGH